MKRAYLCLLVIILAFLCIPLTVSAQSTNVTVTLNGAKVDCISYGQSALIVEGRTLVPLRAIFEALGASVEWNNETRMVTSVLNDTEVSLKIGEKLLYRNGEAIEIDVPAQIMNGRTMVPVRAVSESFGVDVVWDAETRTVILSSDFCYKRGEISDGTYTSAWLGMEYRLPDGFGFASEKELKYIMGIAADVSLDDIDINSTASMYEFQASDGLGRSIALVTEKQSDNTELEDYLMSNVARSFEDMGVKYSLGSTYTLDILELDYFAVDALIEMNGKKLYMTVASAKKSGCIETVMLVYSAPDDLRRMLSHFSPFEKSPA